MQVVHFDTEVRARAVLLGARHQHASCRRTSPCSGRSPCPTEFHSRASAVARRYAYVLLESPVRPSVESGRVGWVFRPLDGDACCAMPPRACWASTTSPRSVRRAARRASPVKTMRRIDIVAARRLLALRVRGQCLPAPHDPQHHGLPAGGRPGAAAARLDRRGARRRAAATPQRPPSRPTACISSARSTKPTGACRAAPLRMIGCHERRAPTADPAHPHQDLRPDARAGRRCRRAGRRRCHRLRAVPAAARATSAPQRAAELARRCRPSSRRCCCSSTRRRRRCATPASACPTPCCSSTATRRPRSASPPRSGRPWMRAARIPLDEAQPFDLVKFAADHPAAQAILARRPCRGLRRRRQGIQLVTSSTKRQRSPRLVWWADACKRDRWHRAGAAAVQIAGR